MFNITSSGFTADINLIFSSAQNMLKLLDFTIFIGRLKWPNSKRQS